MAAWDDRRMAWKRATNFCHYCGARCRGFACAAHADLQQLDPFGPTRVTNHRRENIAIAERMSSDVLPACPRCGDLLERGAAYCPECGCAVTVQRSVGTVDEPAGDEAA